MHGVPDKADEWIVDHDGKDGTRRWTPADVRGSWEGANEGEGTSTPRLPRSGELGLNCIKDTAHRHDSISKGLLPGGRG